MGFVFFVFVVDLQVRRRNSRWVFPGKAGSASGLQRGRDGGIPGAASGLFPLFLDRRESPNPGVFLGFFFSLRMRGFPGHPGAGFGGFFFWEKGALEFCTVHGAGGKDSGRLRKSRWRPRSRRSSGKENPGKISLFPPFFFLFFLLSRRSHEQNSPNFSGNGNGITQN